MLPKEDLPEGPQAGLQQLSTFPTWHFHEATATQGGTFWTPETCCTPVPSSGPKRSTVSRWLQCCGGPEGAQTSAGAGSWRERLPGGQISRY